ncbi:ATP-binding cassette domain-containing protein [Faecalicatena contorta]|uniref:ATP-binding cassette domain-containing protein n=1 Tax=Faecalicatena contorta TaxID=39482 RepID=UPI001F3C29AB|nr:ABC transporter ATP-binding protein [Faecalicatena contorta]MCF2555151.1 ABC transporter ATP-binding protein [Faecalicatena contorta]
MLRLENVRKQYRDFSLDCSLEVNDGCVTGLIGPNGAGKSTTFKAILNLIHTDGGQIDILGKRAEELTAADRQKIGVVLADSGFSQYLTIQDLIPMLDAMYQEFDKADFISKCEKFQLPLKKKIKEFSTGMRRKLQVLAAISHGAEILIMDEPTAGLDVIARDELLNLLREYMEDEGHSILISSHISSDLEGFCDDIYMIDHGKIVLHEDTDVLLSNYGILKMKDEQFENLDKQYILRRKKESFGYSCLTDEKQFYQENYPEIAIEKGNIDELIMMMIRGEV